MCTNYRPPEADLSEAFSDFPRPNFDYPRETWKDYAAPIVRLGEGERRTDPATFGIVPRKHIKKGLKVFDTMDARAGTIGERLNFKGAWNKLQLCLIPCSKFYEPNYETGNPVRWSIRVATDRPFAIAGLWREWEEPEGRAFSFTMIMVNAQEPVDETLPQTRCGKALGGFAAAGRVRRLVGQSYHRRGAVVSQSVPGGGDDG